MQFSETITALFQYGGTVIMAALFILVFVTDKTKNNKLQEDNNSMLKLLTESQKTMAESNNNIAKSLDIISNNLVTIDNKIANSFFMLNFLLFIFLYGIILYHLNAHMSISTLKFSFFYHALKN